MAEIGDDNRRLTGRDADDLKGSRAVGRGDKRGALDHDVGADERCSGNGVHDTADDAAVVRLGVERSDTEQQPQQHR